jgi:hypothetical protein
MSVQWDPNKVPGQDLSSEDYALFTRAAVATGLLEDVLPYEGGAVEFRSVEKSYDCYRVPLYYWYYFSAVDLESLAVDEKFCHLLQAGVDDAYIVLLLSLLTNLRRLSLRCVQEMRNSLPWARALQRYSKLREFTAIPESLYGSEYCPLSLWVDILKLPTLELFTAHGCARGFLQDDRVLTRSPFTIVSDSLNIRRLVVERCGLDYGDLKLMLGGCHDLKSFQYSSTRWLVGSVTSAQIIDLLAPFQVYLPCHNPA